jgi:hypothetical protein
MRRGLRTRLIATAIVAIAVAVAGGVAMAQVFVAPGSIDQTGFLLSTPPEALLTVFNGSDQNLTINATIVAVNCTGGKVTAIDQHFVTGLPTVLAPSELVQLAITADPLTGGTESCDVDVGVSLPVGNPVASIDVPVTFGASPQNNVIVEPEPGGSGLLFGTRFAEDPATQTIHLYNSSSAPVTMVVGATSNIQVVGGSNAMAQCPTLAASCTVIVAEDSTADVSATCAPTGTVPSSVFVMPQGGSGSAVTVFSTNCVAESPVSTHLTMTSPIALSSSNSYFAMAQFDGSATDLLTDAFVLEAASSTITLDGADGLCAGQNDCSFHDGYMFTEGLTLTCTPNDTLQTGTLVVHGSTDDLDTAFATVTCMPTGSGGSGGGPVLGAAPTSLAFPGTPVLSSSVAMAVMVGDTGSDATNVIASVDDNADFELGCGASPCSLGTIAAGNFVTVDVTFTPQSAGPIQSTLRFTATGASEVDVELTGSGDGYAIALVMPPGGAIDFGNIGRNVQVPAEIEIQATGNAPSTTELSLQSTGAQLFALAPSSIQLDGGGQTGSAAVTCGSAVAGSASGTIALTTAGAYAGRAISIPVSCTIEPTDVTQSPSNVAFGEVRRNPGATVPAPVTVTLTNNGTSASMIGAVTMAPSSRHVTFTQPAATLASGAMTSFQIAVDPSATNGNGQTFDEDFTTTPHVLTIPVDTARLTVTVTGAVVDAQTALLPPPPGPLDLGTACVSSTSSAPVTLANIGTAHVAARAPTIGSGFVVVGTGSGELAPGSGAGTLSTIAVMSTPVGTAGEVDGTLTWTTDVPDDYQLPVKEVVITTGAAIGPATLSFPLQPPGIISPAQTVDMQDCDSTPETATVGGVINHVGEASVWHVQPGTYDLPPGQRVGLAIAFAPTHSGHYYAELPITANGKTTRLQLSGDATGPIDQTPTDFYACGCHGAGPPLQGWPIVVVMVWVVRRGRRRGGADPDPEAEPAPTAAAAIIRAGR